MDISTISRNDGLPSNQVHKLAQDSYGRLWMAGPAGLSRFDGSTIYIFDQRNGLKCQGLRTVTVNEGVIWIGTDQGLEAITIDGKQIDWSFFLDWEYGIAECIRAYQDKLWVGSSKGLLKLQYTSSTKRLELVLFEEIGFVKDILVIHEDLIFTSSTTHGLISHDGNGWEKIKLENFESEDTVNCIALSKNNELLVGTSVGLYILSLSGQPIKHFTISNYSPRVNALCVSNDGYWVNFGSSVFWLNKIDDSSERDLSPILKSTKINALYKDFFENIWVTTDTAGVHKISCLRNVLIKKNLAKEGAVYSIRPSNGFPELRIGADSFACALSENNEKAQEYANLPPTIYWDSCIDPQDSSVIWWASQEGVFKQNKEGELDLLKRSHPILASPGRTFCVRDKELWIGTISGLLRYKNGLFEEIRGNGSVYLGYVYSINLAPKNKIWVASLGKGLWLFEEDVLKPICNDILTDNGNTYAVVSNELGYTLVIQDAKIVLLDPQLNIVFSLEEHPVAGWSALWLDNKTVVIGSSDGVKILDIVSQKIIKRINPLLGAGGWEFTHNRAMWLDIPNKLVYCGINAGLYVVDLSKIVAFVISPSIKFEELEWIGCEPQLDNGKYKVKTGKWSVMIRAFSAWLIDEKQILFRFKLVGFDQDWSELSPLSSTRYSSLPPGLYSLQGQAYSPLGGYGPIETICEIEVLMPWWAWGFSSFFSGISSVYNRFVMSRVRNKGLIERNIELLEEINLRKDAEEELLLYRKQLELLVEKRTEELQKEIIQRAKAQEDFRESELRFRAIYENTSEAFGVLKDGVEMMVNPAYVNLFGFSTDEEIIGYPFIQRFAEEERTVILEFLQKNAEERPVYLKLETWGQRKNEEHFPMEINISPFNADYGDTIVIIRDISAQKEYEDVIISAKEEAEKANRIKSEFLAGMSHELRTPLNAILGYAQILRRDLLLNEGQLKGVNTIYRSGEHLLQMINDILDLAKIDAYKLELINTPFNLEDFLKNLLEMFSIKAQEKGIALEYSFDDQLPKGITADEKRLKQVLINLLNNAIKFTKRGKVEFKVSLEDANNLFFEVVDTGIGIPTNKMANIFNPFFQADNIKEKTEGTGLGLSICKSILRLMGTELNVKSTLGVGSSFAFSLPIENADTFVEETHVVSLDVVLGFKGPSYRILVVDDKYENTELISDILTTIGFVVDQVDSGVNALFKVREHKYDLIIMDLVMPYMDGFETAKCIRNLKSIERVPMIAATANIDEKTRKKADESGFEGFIAKPIAIDALLNTIQKVLKLEWVYEDKGLEQSPKKDLPLVYPDQQLLEKLLHAAQVGDITSIEDWVAALKNSDNGLFLPFAQKVEGMVNKYQFKKIAELIKSKPSS